MSDNFNRGNQPQTGTHQCTSQRPMWQNFSDRYRSEWEGRYGKDKPWMHHEDAFRYGWEAGTDTRFHGRDFHAVSSDMERDWPNRWNRWGGNAPQDAMTRTWNDFKDTVREGFDWARREFNKTF